MECSLADKLLKEYVNKKLDKQHICVLKNHLKHCKHCSKLLLTYNVKKYYLRVSIVVLFIAASIFIFVHSVNKAELPSEETKPKIVSNIIIEVFTKDQANDTNTVKELTASALGQIVSEMPLSIKLTKTNTEKFIKDLGGVLLLPEGIDKRIDAFIGPLNNNDEIIVKIKFLEKQDETR